MISQCQAPIKLNSALCRYATWVLIFRNCLITPRLPPYDIHAGSCYYFISPRNPRDKFSLQQDCFYYMHHYSSPPPLLLNIGAVNLPTNPQTPSFGKPSQLLKKQPQTNSCIEPNIKTQESNLLEQQPNFMDKQPGFNENRPPKSKNTVDVTPSANNQQLVNSLLRERKNLLGRLEKTEEQNQKLTTKLGQKQREFELVKLQLQSLKNALKNKTVKEQVVPTTPNQRIESSRGVFHSKRWTSELPKPETNNFSSKQKQNNEKVFKDRLERVCRRLEMLEEQQQMIRLKNKMNATNSR